MQGTHDGSSRDILHTGQYEGQQRPEASSITRRTNVVRYHPTVVSIPLQKEKQFTIRPRTTNQQGCDNVSEHLQYLQRGRHEEKLRDTIDYPVRAA